MSVSPNGLSEHYVVDEHDIKMSTNSGNITNYDHWGLSIRIGLQYRLLCLSRNVLLVSRITL